MNNFINLKYDKRKGKKLCDCCKTNYINSNKIAKYCKNCGKYIRDEQMRVFISQKQKYEKIINAEKQGGERWLGRFTRCVKQEYSDLDLADCQKLKVFFEKVLQHE